MVSVARDQFGANQRAAISSLTLGRVRKRRKHHVKRQTASSKWTASGLQCPAWTN